MLETLDFDSEYWTSPLKDRLYRSNYAVLLDSIVGQLPQDMKDETEYLWEEYAKKFPIASTHRYCACALIDEYSDPDLNTFSDPVEATVIPASLLYSMSNLWQDRMCAIWDALSEVEPDNNSYKIELLRGDRVQRDPYDDRSKRWDAEVVGYQYQP